MSVTTVTTISTTATTTEGQHQLQAVPFLLLAVRFNKMESQNSLLECLSLLRCTSTLENVVWDEYNICVASTFYLSGISPQTISQIDIHITSKWRALHSKRLRGRLIHFKLSSTFKNQGPHTNPIDKLNPKWRHCGPTFWLLIMIYNGKIRPHRAWRNYRHKAGSWINYRDEC